MSDGKKKSKLTATIQYDFMQILHVISFTKNENYQPILDTENRQTYKEMRICKEVLIPKTTPATLAIIARPLSVITPCGSGYF